MKTPVTSSSSRPAQRANSSAPPTSSVNKILPTTSSKLAPNNRQTSTNSSSRKTAESGKVNSNYDRKDVDENGYVGQAMKNKHESKQQDGKSRMTTISDAADVTTTLSVTPLLIPGQLERNTPASLLSVETSSFPASSTTSCSEKQNTTNLLASNSITSENSITKCGHAASVLSNGHGAIDCSTSGTNGTIILTSKASNDSNIRDKKFSVNKKQSNKYPPQKTPGFIINSRDSIRDKSLSNESPTIPLQYDETCNSRIATFDQSNGLHDISDGSNKAISPDQPPDSTQMAQQELSLLMLRVGLKPPDQTLKRGRSSVAKSRYVRLQDPIESPLSDIDSSTNPTQDHDWILSIHQGSPFAPRSEEADLEGEGANEGEEEEANDDKCRIRPRPSTLRPTFLSNHDALRLQVQFPYSDSDERQRSISLPSSPRSSRCNHSGSGAITRRAAHQTNDKTEMNFNQALFQQDCENPFAHRSKALKPQDRVQWLHDDREPHSMNSSSCSSLNYYPPLLAISNKLNNIKIEQLIKNSIDQLAEVCTQPGPIRAREAQRVLTPFRVPTPEVREGIFENISTELVIGQTSESNRQEVSSIENLTIDQVSSKQISPPDVVAQQQLSYLMEARQVQPDPSDQNQQFR